MIFALAPGDHEKQQNLMQHYTHTQIVKAYITQLIYG
jgi:hypothetical protein